MFHRLARLCQKTISRGALAPGFPQEPDASAFRLIFSQPRSELRRISRGALAPGFPHEPDASLPNPPRAPSDGIIFVLRYGPPHKGLTLVELLMAMAIVSIMVAALAVLATTVQTVSRHSHGHDRATQHARVVLERIERTLLTATASEQFPGFAAFSDQIGLWQLPDTLVVWHPKSAAADPQGLPLLSELVVYCCDPSLPNQLLEIRALKESRPAPPLSDAAAWKTELEAIKTSASSERVPLTDLLRVASVGDGAVSQRGAVRFDVILRPSNDAWNNYLSGALAWSDLPWVQDIFSSQAGLRQAWCRIELQLMPGENTWRDDPAGETALPFFGSAAIYYELRKR